MTKKNEPDFPRPASLEALEGVEPDERGAKAAAIEAASKSLDESLAERLSNLSEEKVRELLEKVAEAEMTPQLGVTRELLGQWFPLRNQRHGLREIHELAQMLAKRMAEPARKDGYELALALRHLREAIFWASQAIPGE